MAFGDTGILDSFNRANNSSLGSNWTENFRDGSDLAIISNQVGNEVGGLDDAYWNPSTFGPDSEVFVTFATLPSGANDNLALWIRLDPTPIDGYTAFYSYQAATDNIKIYEVTNNAATQLGATISQDFAAGDKFGLEVIGSTIKVYRDDGTGWAEVASRTDATHSAAGNIAMEIEKTVARFDDFGGGTVAAAGAAEISRLAGRPLLRAVQRGIFRMGG